MTKIQYKVLKRAGFTLIETMTAILLLMIISLGAFSFEFLSAKHERAALTKLTGARTAQLIIEDWKSTGGSTEYDPTKLNLGVTDSDLDEADYEITADNLPMYINLSYNNVEHDDDAQITLRQLVVQVNWRDDRSKPTGQTDEESSIEISTYVRVDASGG